MAVVAAQGVEKGDSAAYQQKLMGLLGNQDPIRVLSRTTDVLSGIVESYPAELLRQRPFEGKWTPNEIIGHLSDSEWVYGFRIRLILCQDRPVILGMDQDLWVEGQRHNERAPRDLVTVFRHLRGANLELWKSMSAEDLRRIGQHNERGEESLGLMLQMNAGHDLSHIDQITRYIAAINGAK